MSQRAQGVFPECPRAPLCHGTRFRAVPRSSPGGIDYDPVAESQFVNVWACLFDCVVQSDLEQFGNIGCPLMARQTNLDSFRGDAAAAASCSLRPDWSR